MRLKLLLVLAISVCLTGFVYGQTWNIEVKGTITSGFNYDLSKFKVEYDDTFIAVDQVVEGNTIYYYDAEGNSLVISTDTNGKDTIVLDMTYNNHVDGIYYACFFQGDSAKKLKGTGFAEAYVKIIHMNADTGEQWVDVDSTMIPIKCKMR